MAKLNKKEIENVKNNKTSKKKVDKKNVNEKKRARCIIVGIKIKEKEIQVAFHDTMTWNDEEMVIFVNSVPVELKKYKDKWFDISDTEILIDLIYQLYNNKNLLWVEFENDSISSIEATNG